MSEDLNTNNDAMQRLYGLMAIVEEQQKTLDTALAQVKDTATELARERAMLSSTVKSISAQVSESAAESILKAIGSAQAGFNAEMDATTAKALKTAQEASREIERAKNELSGMTGELSRNISKTSFVLILIFSILGTLSLGGLYLYFLNESSKAQDTAKYWTEQATTAWKACQKMKNCPKD